MALIKLSNNGVKNITSVGSIGTGDLVFISKQTASSSASISFTSGIDSTYKEYIFYFINCHPSTQSGLYFNGSTDGGSNYNVAKTTTYFLSRHAEDGSSNELSYKTGLDLAQGTGFQPLNIDQVNDNDSSMCGFLHLFNPSSTTFVKHYISRTQQMQVDDSMENYSAGYFNTTSAIDGIRFQYSSGNIDSGDILLYGVN
jgi:hypothetical protein